MAKKDTPTAPGGRSDPPAVIQGIPDPKIERALEWIERLLTSVQGLKDRAERERSYYGFVAWGLDRANAAAAKAVTGSLKSIGYPGEAARIRSLHRDLARDAKEMLLRSDPAYVPASEFEMAYLVLGGTTKAAYLERALLEVQTAVCRDAQKHRQADSGPLAPEARAILFVQERIKNTGKLPTKTAIAEVLGVKRRTLYNWTAFKVAYKKLQSETRRQPARGSKAKDGTLEAWRESGK